MLSFLPTVIQHSLLRHTATSDDTTCAIQASAQFDNNGALLLSYFVARPSGDILLPAKQPATAADGLWQHTCCEAFIAAVDCQEYREFNFSPSCQWANYRFTDYRERDMSFTPATAPLVTCHRQATGFQLDARLPRDLLPTAETFNIALTAIIEITDGSKSYWALAHCAAQPDFHRRQSFTLTLSTTNR